MTDRSLDELGPVDYIVVEFPAGAANFTGEMVEELLRLVEAGIIRVIDVLILTKNADGSVDAAELSDVADLGPLQELEAELAGAPRRRRRRAPRRRDGAREHRRGLDLGESVGRAVRRRGAAFRRSVDRQRTDSHPGDHRLDRS